MRLPFLSAHVLLASISIAVLTACGDFSDFLTGTSPVDAQSPVFANAKVDVCYTLIEGVTPPEDSVIKIRSRKNGTEIRLVAPPWATFEEVPGFMRSADGRELIGPLREGEVLCAPLVASTPLTRDRLSGHVGLYEREGVEWSFVSGQRLAVEFRDAQILEAMRAIAAIILRDPLEPLVFPEYIGKGRFESSGLQEERVPEAVTEIVATATATVKLIASEVTEHFGKPTFPEGTGDVGFTVLPDLPAQQPAGEWCFASMVCDDDIPLAAPVKHYQFGFVCDQDGDPSNNHVPPPAFPLDTFRGTDLWFVLTYEPVGGWRLAVRDARDGAVVDIPSAARVIINGNAIVLFVPKSEFGVAEPSFRFTTFCHEGDFGQNPPFVWSGDYHPEPGDGATGGGGGPGGSAEAQQFNGDWLLDGQARDHCITIANGTITLWDEDCDTSLLGLTSSAPGRTENGVVIWVVGPSDGRVFELRQDTTPGALSPTSLTITPAGGNFGAVSFPVLIPR